MKSVRHLNVFAPFPAQFCAGERLLAPAWSEGNDVGMNRRNVNNEVSTPLHLRRTALCTR